jgi:hypothetical protein
MQAAELLQQVQEQRAEVQTNLEALVKQHSEQTQLALKLDGAIEVLIILQQESTAPEILDGGDIEDEIVDAIEDEIVDAIVEDEIVDAIVVDTPKPKNARSNSKTP